MDKLHFSKGDYIYRLGDASVAVFLVRSGQVELTSLYPETGEGVDEALGIGRVFGGLELIDESERRNNARAVEETELLAWDREELLELLFKNPAKSLVLNRTAFNQLRDLFSGDTLDSELARLRSELQLNIRDAVIAHESRVVTSHNGMAAIAIPIVLMIVLALGAYWFFHRT